MPATTTHITGANTENGTLTAQTQTPNGLTLQQVKTEAGEKSIIRGYAATTHIDKTNDQFTPEALQEMAAAINNDAEQTISMVMPEMSGMAESQIGNINHNNNPAAERLIGAGDTRIVPVFRTTNAQTIVLDDGQMALEIEGEMLPLPDDLEEAVKGQIREGGLHSFSIEFQPIDTDFVEEDGESIRRINSARPNGTALTGRPMNDNAQVTDAELKNIMAQHSQEEKSGHKDEKKGIAKYEEEVKQADVYTSEEEAMQRAEELGLDGVHTHTMDGETVYMPGETHEEYEQAVNAEHEQKKDDDYEGKNNVLNEDTTMTDEDQDLDPEAEAEEEPQESGESEAEAEGEEEQKEELKSDIDELKNMFSEIKSENEKLREENDELKSKVDDLKTLDTLKSEVKEFKSMLEENSDDLEGDTPMQDADTAEDRDLKNEEVEEEKADWQKEIDSRDLDEHDLKSTVGSKKVQRAELIAEDYDVKTDEVLDYAK